MSHRRRVSAFKTSSRQTRVIAVGKIESTGTAEVRRRRTCERFPLKQGRRRTNPIIEARTGHSRTRRIQPRESEISKRRTRSPKRTFKSGCVAEIACAESRAQMQRAESRAKCAQQRPRFGYISNFQPFGSNTSKRDAETDLVVPGSQRSRL